VLRTLRRIAGFWRPHRWLATGLALTMLLEVGFTVALAIALKWIVDAVVDGGSGSAAPVIVLLVAALVVSGAAAVVRGRLSAAASAVILADVRTAMFDRLQRLSLGFFASTGEGSIMARFSSDVALLSEGVIRRPLDGLRSLVSIATYVPVMLVLEPRLAIPALLITPVVVVLVNRFAPDADVALDDEKLRVAEVLDRVAENVQTQRAIRAFGLRARSTVQFRGAIETLRDASTIAEFRVAIISVMSTYAIAVVQLSVVAAGAVMAFSGSLDAGAFAAFVALLTEFTWEMTVIGSEVFPQIRKAGSGIRRVDELLTAQPLVEQPRGAAPCPELRDALRLTDVTFAYGPAGVLITGLTVDVAAGTSAVVVGRNGSGKSTLLSLILGFYPPSSGVISVDGVDLRELDLDGWRDHCGVVFQDTVVFNSSLRDNVVLGCAGVDDATVVSALATAGLAHVVARLPDGLDTPLGAGGRVLSGGERQRLGLARAMVRDPALLLLDEVTASLDPTSEADVNAAIDALRDGRTMIRVTHRVEAARDADLVIALDADGGAEVGSFETLLARGGVLAEVARRQQGFTVSRDGGSASVSPHRLGAFSLFRHFDEQQLDELARRFTARLYEEGEVVVRQGGPADRFFIIARGVVEVLREHNGASGLVAHLEDGDFFGEMALLDGASRNATVKAVTPTTMLSLDRSEFEELLGAWPDTAQMIRAEAASRAEQNRAAGEPA
jgi:ATP-binding cassette subfamily B protein